MIKQLSEQDNIDINMLCKSCCGRRILAYYNAYGIGYDFCRFYIAENENSYAYITIINATMLICGSENISAEEITIFADMQKPFRIEGTQKILEKICGNSYQKLKRTTFHLVCNEDVSLIDNSDICFEPRLDDVYEILKEGFPNLLDYGLWLTDTSHRVRHGVSKVLTYKGSTCATLVYDIDGYVLVGQVATKLEVRGSGYARTFLRWLAHYLQQQGKKAYLFALDIRESFYREIGFEAVSSEFVLERNDEHKDNIAKGKLQ